jgi:hypothetical protein
LLLASAAQSLTLLQAATFALREGSPTVVAYIDDEDPDTVVIAHYPAWSWRHRVQASPDGKVVVMIGDDPNTMFTLFSKIVPSNEVTSPFMTPC